MGAIRNRARPPGSLRERLLAMARVARRKAQQVPDGPARRELLRKADQSERTAAVEKWIRSPGLEPPE
jgi:hypothetical protein